MRNYLTALVTDQNVLARAQLLWLPDDVSRVKLLWSLFEQQEEVLVDFIHHHADTSTQCMNTQAAMTRWLGDNLKRLVVSSYNCTDVLFSVVSRAIRDGRTWSVLPM